MGDMEKKATAGEIRELTPLELMDHEIVSLKKRLRELEEARDVLSENPSFEIVLKVWRRYG